MKNKLAKHLFDNTNQIAEFLRSYFNLKSDRAIVEEVADILDVKLGVNRVYELQDSPDKCFVWDLDMTDQQVNEFTGNVQNLFVRKHNRDPEALHFFRNDIDGIDELDPAEVRERVKPWLNDQGEDE